MHSTRIAAAELKDLAEAGTRVVMHLGSADLARLSELLVFDRRSEPGCGAERDAGPATLDAVVRFDTGPEDYPRLHIVVTGKLSLRCQRCLHAMQWPLDLVTCVTVADDDECAQQLAKPFDSIVAGVGGLALQTVIEDEILATLPMTPMHDSGEQCSVAGGLTVDSETEMETETGQTYRPFANLMSMVGGGGDER